MCPTKQAKYACLVPALNRNGQLGEAIQKRLSPIQPFKPTTHVSNGLPDAYPLDAADKTWHTGYARGWARLSVRPLLPIQMGPCDHATHTLCLEILAVHSSYIFGMRIVSYPGRPAGQATQQWPQKAVGSRQHPAGSALQSSVCGWQADLLKFGFFTARQPRKGSYV